MKGSDSVEAAAKWTAPAWGMGRSSIRRRRRRKRTGHLCASWSTSFSSPCWMGGPTSSSSFRTILLSSALVLLIFRRLLHLYRQLLWLEPRSDRTLIYSFDELGGWKGEYEAGIDLLVDGQGRPRHLRAQRERERERDRGFRWWWRMTRMSRDLVGWDCLPRGTRTLAFRKKGERLLRVSFRIGPPLLSFSVDGGTGHGLLSRPPSLPCQAGTLYTMNKRSPSQIEEKPPFFLLTTHFPSFWVSSKKMEAFQYIKPVSTPSI